MSQRDVDAADRDRVDMDEPPAGEHADRGRAAAEIDHRRAELGLVVDQRREARRVGRGHHRLDPRWQRSTTSMRLRAAASSQEATCRSTPSSSPIMPLGSLTSRVRVEREPVGEPVQHGAARAGRSPRDAASSTRWMSCSDTVLPRSATLAANRCEDSRPPDMLTMTLADLDAGHPLGRVDGEPGRVLGRLADRRSRRP